MPSGGEMKQVAPSRIAVTGADEVVIYVDVATNFVRYDDISADPDERLAERMAIWEPIVREGAEGSYQGI